MLIVVMLDVFVSHTLLADKELPMANPLIGKFENSGFGSFLFHVCVSFFVTAMGHTLLLPLTP
jgi:hypothetical protein